MALAAGSCGGSRILCGNYTRTPNTCVPHSLHFTLPFSTRNLHIVSAKRFSPRTGRLDGKDRRGSVTTEDQEEQRTDGVQDVVGDADDGYFLPELPGDKPDFWEGPQWDALGFFVQYLWAFGIVFAVIYWNSYLILVFIAEMKLNGFFVDNYFGNKGECRCFCVQNNWILHLKVMLNWYFVPKFFIYCFDLIL